MFTQDFESIDITTDEDFTKRLGNTFSKEFSQALKDSRAILAGGAMTSYFSNAEINDFDLYFESQECIKKFLLNLPKGMDGRYFMTNKSMTIKTDGLNLQLIYYKYHPANGWYAEKEANDHYQVSVCESIFKSFDFTVNMCAYSFSSDTIVFHKNFFKDLGKRKVRFWKGTDYPLVSALRLDKYLAKGYTVPTSEKLKVLCEVSKLNLNSVEALIENIGSMYGLKTKKLEEQLKEKIEGGWEFDATEAIDLVVDSLKIESTYNLVSSTVYNSPDWDNFENMIKQLKLHEGHKEEYTVVPCYRDISDNIAVRFSLTTDEKENPKVEWVKKFSINSTYFVEELRLVFPELEVPFDYLTMLDPNCKEDLHKRLPITKPTQQTKEDETISWGIPF